MIEYPKMLYRPGTKVKVWGVSCDTLIVRDEDEEAAALGNGWALRPDGEPERPRAEHPQLDHDNSGKDGGSITAPGDLTALRAEYKRLVGKAPFNGWDEATLRAKMVAAGGQKGGGDADQS